MGKRGPQPGKGGRPRGTRLEHSQSKKEAPSRSRETVVKELRPFIEKLSQLKYCQFVEHCNVTGHLQQADEIAVCIMWNQIQRCDGLYALIDGTDSSNWDKDILVQIDKAERSIGTAIAKFGLTPRDRSVFGPTRVEELEAVKEKTAFERRAEIGELLGVSSKQ